MRRNLPWIVTVVLGILILIPSMIGFVIKFEALIRFVSNSRGSLDLSQLATDGGFAITPVVNYLLASAGFLCLLLAAALNGMFNDIEKPKYLMLENEERLDQTRQQ